MKPGKRDICGNTTLHLACAYKIVFIVQLLCQDSRFSPGAINEKNRVGDRPLLIAVQRGHLDIVKELDIEERARMMNIECWSTWWWRGTRLTVLGQLPRTLLLDLLKIKLMLSLLDQSNNWAELL